MEQMKKYDHWITWKTDHYFAIPLMLEISYSGLYDGRYHDRRTGGRVEALAAAVGAGDWLVWLVFGIMTGITQVFYSGSSSLWSKGEKKI